MLINVTYLKCTNRRLFSTTAAKKRVWMSTENGVKIMTLTENRLEETLKLIRMFYFKDEPLARALNLKKYPEAINEIIMKYIEVYKDGNSIVAIKNEQVAGVMFSQIRHQESSKDNLKYIKEIDLTCQNEYAREYLRFVPNVYALKDVFAHYNVTSCLDMMDELVVPSFRGSGVGTMLIVASEAVARARSLPLISTILTSRSTRLICKKLLWQEILEVPLSRFESKERPFTLQTEEKVAIAAKLL